MLYQDKINNTIDNIYSFDLIMVFAHMEKIEMPNNK